MVSHALPRKFAFYTETTFVTGGPADWVADGTFAYAIGPDISGVMQETTENENNVLRPRAKHANIRTLKNASASFGLYMHSSPATAAEGAAAVTYHVAELLHAAIGGRDLGFAAAVVSDGAEVAGTIQIDADPGYVKGDWVYAFDTSAGVGEFYRVSAVTIIGAGPEHTLTLDRPQHFVPDVGGADTIRAVIDCYIHQAATTQHDHASHKTLQMLVQGDAADDVYECKGVKPAVSIEAITAGEPTKLSFDCLVTTFELEDAVAAAFGAAIPVGEPGAVPGVATTTSFKMADVGAALVEVVARGSITVEPGVAYERVMGPNGHEGVHGHVDDLGDTTVEVMVPFDTDFNSEFRAGVEKHLLCQVGNTTDAWAVYLPRVEYGTEPARSDEGGLTTSALSFRGLENQTDPGALAGDNLEKWRSPFHILIVA